VGRQSELRTLEGLVAKHRLITLVGVGGCGKTRLAIELAAAASDRFPAGVAFADLASLRAPEEVADAVAQALGLSPGVASKIADLLRGTRLLLVIDNAEHLLDAVSALVGDLLRRCPNLTVLVTSRELLNVDGEVTWPVPLLRLPPELPPGAPPDVEVVGACDAIELFVTRAAERQASFRLQPDNVRLVDAICRRLDGIPLALELAAARTMSMSLSEIVRRLGDSFRLLTQGTRASVARHQTLRATLEWSYGLLDERERRLLWRLSAFVGSFDIAAIEAVCAEADLPAPDVADVLRRLVEKSLVVPQPGGDGSLRYGLLEVVRQYGQERLQERPEEAGGGGLRARHASYYAGVVRRLGLEARSDLKGSTERMTAEYDNVRLALGWAARQAPDLEATLVIGLRWYWTIRSLVREARDRLRSALEKEHPSPETRASLYTDAASWSQWADDLEAARAEAEVAYATLDQIDDVRLAARVMMARAMVNLGAGDPAAARADLLQVVAMLQDQPPSQSLVIAQSRLAMVHVAAGRPAEALDEAERASLLQEALPGPRSSVSSFFLLHARGAALLALGCVEDAREQFLRGLDLAVELDSDGVAAGFLAYLACAAAAGAEPARCLELLAAAERCARTVGSTQALAFIPIEAAERASREALSDRAAARAWAAGLRLDARAALARVRADQSPPLTQRRLTIANLVAEGLSDKEIASRLGISKRTVETHLLHVRQKLGLSNRAQIAAWAVSRGISQASST
jgi:predicted ATPase/DNA-binding CsgD family transcriptional regulator